MSNHNAESVDYSRRQRYGGFVMILLRGMAADREAPLLADTESMLSHFIGPHSTEACVEHNESLAWGMLIPGPNLPLTSWSVFRDSQVVCLLEGEFYQEAWGCLPAKGFMKGLAEGFVRAYEQRGPSAVNQLNGSFCGAICWPTEQRAVLVVDRFATRGLYWRLLPERLLISTNQGAFRADQRSPRAMDNLAMLDMLTTTVIVGDHTLIRDVKYVPASHVATYHKGRMKYERYWRWPERRQARSLERSARAINEAMESHIRRVSARLDKPVVQALSGGHDSRVVVSGLRHNRVPVTACCYARQFAPEGDVLHARRIAALAGMDFHLVPHNPEENLRRIPDVIVQSAGTTCGFAYMRLGPECASLSNAGFIGFNGDTLSGDFHGGHPWRYRTLDEMASVYLRLILNEHRPEAANRFLPEPLTDPEGTVYERWRSGFPDDPAENLTDRFLFHQVLTVNRRTMFDPINLVRLFITPIYPFLDTGVLDTYVRLPHAHMIGRAAHAIAGYRRFPEMGKVPPSNRFLPINLDWQTARIVLPLIECFRKTTKEFRKLRKLAGRLRNRKRQKSSSPNVYLPLMEATLRNSDCYDSATVNYVLDRFRTNTVPDSVPLVRMAQLSLFHRVYVAGQTRDLPLTYLNVEPRTMHLRDLTEASGESTAGT